VAISNRGAAMATKITRLDHDALELRVACVGADREWQDRGATAGVASVLDGCTRAEAARQCGMDRQTCGIG
jgi:hypothetical protein